MICVQDLRSRIKGIIIVLAVVAAALAATGRNSSAKPLNPLQGQFRPEEISAKVGATVKIVLELESLHDFEKVKITVKVPKGLKLTQGETSVVVTDVRQKEKKEITFVFEVREPGEQKIWARAEVLGLSPHEIIAQSYLAVVNREEKPQDFEIKKDGGGRKIRVHEVPNKSSQ